MHTSCDAALITLIIMLVVLIPAAGLYDYLSKPSATKVKYTTPEKLKSKYRFFPIEYPEGLSIEAWKEDVAAQLTLLGYWEWAAAQTNQRLRDPCARCGTTNVSKRLHNKSYICPACVKFYDELSGF